MAIRLRRPSTDHLERLATRCRNEELTYSPALVTRSGEALAGYQRDSWATDLGRGVAVFERSADALFGWRMHQGAGLVVAPLEPPVVGNVVALAAPLPIGFVEAVCRIVDLDESDHRRGFVYGTLATHPESGEESFVVTIDPDESVRFEIVAVSRPRHPLARLAPPIARRLQEQAIGRYLDAVRSSANG